MQKTEEDKKLQEITRKIVREFQPEKIILFGSWTWGDPTEDSDIDLLVIKESTEPRIKLERELDALIFPRDFAMDVLVYSPSELDEKINRDRNFFLEDIIRNGRVLYETPKSVTNIPSVQEFAIV